jgi:hypothetical protein
MMDAERVVRTIRSECLDWLLVFDRHRAASSH